MVEGVAEASDLGAKRKRADLAGLHPDARLNGGVVALKPGAEMTVMSDDANIGAFVFGMSTAEGFDDGSIADAAGDGEPEVVKDGVDGVGIAGVDDGGAGVVGGAADFGGEGELKRKSDAESGGGDELGPAVGTSGGLPRRLEGSGVEDEFGFERTEKAGEGRGFELREVNGLEGDARAKHGGAGVGDEGEAESFFGVAAENDHAERGGGDVRERVDDVGGEGAGAKDEEVGGIHEEWSERSRDSVYGGNWKLEGQGCQGDIEGTEKATVSGR